MSTTMNEEGTSRVAVSLEDLPLDFMAFLGCELGISQADAEARLGRWIRELDRARYGYDRLGPSSSAAVVLPLTTIPERKARADCRAAAEAVGALRRT
jgi:hypothetical protein